MTDPEQDEVFDAYLKRRPVLPPLDGNPEPPVALDAKVLAQAREAIGPRAARDRTAPFGSGATRRSTATGGDGPRTPAANGGATPRAPRWAVPIALAATILLCLSVVINVNLNANRPSPNIERATAARADLKASGKVNAMAESSAAASSYAAARTAPPGDRDANAASAPAPAPAPASALASNGDERRQSISGGIPSGEVVLPEAKVAGVPPPRAPVESEAAQSAESIAQADGTNAGSALADAPTAEGALADGASAGGASVSSARAGRSVSAAEKAALFAKRAGVANPSQSPPAAASHPSDPKVWLQQIDALRAAGKTAEADAEMRRFTAAFPAYATKPAAAKPVPPAPADRPK